MEQFTGKKAVVIGGSGGIGAELSLKLAQSGAQVLVHGGHNQDKINKLLERLHHVSPSQDTHQGLLQELSAERLQELPTSPLMEEIRASDILCVAFGPFLQKSLEDTSPQDWISTTLLNYALPGICVSAVLPHMKALRWGRILLFGGTLTHSVKGFLTNAAYGGAKTALCSLVKSTAVQYSSWGITCNGILPGLTVTEYQSADQLTVLAKKNPSGSVIPADRVAQAAMNLLSIKEINGALLNVDDGWSP